MDDRDIEEFHTSGCLVLHRVFEPFALAAEMDVAFARGFRAGSAPNTGTGDNAFRYVPMMCESTPVSLALLDALAVPATRLLGRNVLPTRAKGTLYLGSTTWHRDSDSAVPSLGFAAYLEPLDGHDGALRVMRGSHHEGGANPPPALATMGLSHDGVAIATVPGDVIAFDEHLWHASTGGTRRRQWRVDFVVDPVDVAERSLVEAYFAGNFQPGWDGGYDVDRYPSYGSHWQSWNRDWVNRLRDLGVYRLADDEESAVRLSAQAEERVPPSDS